MANTDHGLFSPGFGFEDSRHTPGLVRSIASYINNSHPGGVYLMAGGQSRGITGHLFFLFFSTFMRVLTDILLLNSPCALADLYG